MDWTNKKVLVTGGASFIGSHLVDALLQKGAKVRVADNLSSGKIENIQNHLDRQEIEFYHVQLARTENAEKAVKDMDIIFHLAANHGGRGYVDLHPAACVSNLTLDGVVFQAAGEASVEKVVFASSGCVYPNYLQTNVQQELYLTEDMVGPPYDADNTYGWAKLMGEFTLQALHRDYGLKTVACRYFTVYGERGHENHAVIAMIARAFIKQSPFGVWGNGEQIRNWTHVSDIVRGTLLAAEKIEDGTAVNLGTMERVKVIDAVREVLRYTGHDASIEFRTDMPTGPMNRVADYSRAKVLLGWEPQVTFMDGLHQTIDWYFSHKKREDVEKVLDCLLTERSFAAPDQKSVLEINKS